MEISQWKMFFVMLTDFLEKEINQRELRDSTQTFRKQNIFKCISDL